MKKKLKETTFQNTLCEAVQGSIFGILLFLIYVDNLCMASSLLTPTMFADDTNLSFFKIRILRNFLIVSEINYRKLPPDLKQINYRLTYLKRNICCFIPRTKSLKLSTPSSIKNWPECQNSSELVNTVIKTVMSTLRVLNDKVL